MPYILALESSCDDTSAALMKGPHLLANSIASQKIHQRYGGVVPELASRAHLQNIVPLLDVVFKDAGLRPSELQAIAFTRGPGLMGSLLVGTSFAKAMAVALNIPLIEVNHLEGHVLSPFIIEDEHSKVPTFPYLCLLVSGGHTQIIRVDAYDRMTILGRTIDDAAGEAFDKSAKIMDLGYPGGPVIDRLAQEGNPKSFVFAKPRIAGLDYSFSGLKTSILYKIRDHLKEDPQFIERHQADLCASIQASIVEILMDKLMLAVKQTGITQVAIGGGVSANSGVRKAVEMAGQTLGWTTFIPKLAFTTDNAAMIGVAAYFKWKDQRWASLDAVPFARYQEAG